MKFNLELNNIDIDQFKELVDEAIDMYSDFGGIPVLMDTKTIVLDSVESNIINDLNKIVGYVNNNIDYENMIIDVNILNTPDGRIVEDIASLNIELNKVIYPVFINGTHLKLYRFKINIEGKII